MGVFTRLTDSGPVKQGGANNEAKLTSDDTSIASLSSHSLYSLRKQIDTPTGAVKIEVDQVSIHNGVRVAFH